MNRLSLLALLAALSSLPPAGADDKELGAKAKEVLVKNCFRCHGETRIGNKNLDVSSHKALITPGASRTPVICQRCCG